jgi:Zn-dependent membrane protease YugP
MFYNMDYLICMIPAFLLVMIASLAVKSAYSRWGKVPARSGLTGVDAARRLISQGGLQDVQIQGTAGTLTDHYDPRNKTLFLSQAVAQNASIASLAVSAHELGHAQQDFQGYFPLRVRSALVPMVQIGSSLGWIMIMVGIVLSSAGWALGVDVAWLGVAAFSGGALFALATLPVELNASARAKRLLAETGIIAGEDEQRGVNAVLNAAAFTYVAALFSAIMQLLYFASMVTGMGRRRS